MEGIKTCPVCKKQDDHCLCLRRKQCTPRLTKENEVSPIGCSKGRAMVIGSVGSLLANKAIPEAVNIPESKNFDIGKEVLTFINQSNCMQSKEILGSKNPTIMSCFDLLENRLDEFVYLIIFGGREICTQSAKMVSTEFFEERTVMMTHENGHLHELKIKCSVSSHMTDFRNSKEYFMKINKKIQKNEKVFVVHEICQKFLCGKVEYVDGRLLFHSMTLTEDPNGVILIPFDELKQFSNPRNYYSFIKVTNNENSTGVIVIKMLNKEKTHHFVKLCTGEYGPTYKGASFTLECNKYSSGLPRVVNVPHFIENGREVSRPVDFNIGDESSDLVDCKAGEMYLSFQSKTGGFKMFEVNETKDLKSIIGVVMMTSPIFCPSLSDVEPSNLKIVDCGIAFEI